MSMSDNERIMIAERLVEIWEMSKGLDFVDKASLTPQNHPKRAENQFGDSSVR